MRRIAPSIFVALLILCFASNESFALGNPNCQKWDFLCHWTGKGAKTPIDSDENVKKVKKVKKTISEEASNETELNFFTGMFDFSDHKQKAGLFGIQHQNEDLFRNSFLGKLSPITGGFLTEKNAFYLYTGVQAEYEIGFLKITPSFAPGYYNYGDGKDLGSPLEFKSEVQMSFNLSDNSQMGMSYNHISNASIGSKNPGANSYMFNFLKQF